MVLSKPFKCSMCDYTGPSGDMAKHVALTGGSEHEQWRIRRDFPAKITVQDLHKYLRELRIKVVGEFSQFAERGPVKTKIHEYWDAYHDATGVLKPVALKLKKDILAYCESAGCEVKRGRNLDKHVEAMTTIAAVSLCPWANEAHCPCYRMRNQGICKSGLLKKSEREAGLQVQNDTLPPVHL